MGDRGFSFSGVNNIGSEAKWYGMNAGKTGCGVTVRLAH